MRSDSVASCWLKGLQRRSEVHPDESGRCRFIRLHLESQVGEHVFEQGSSTCAVCFGLYEGHRGHDFGSSRWCLQGVPVVVAFVTVVVGSRHRVEAGTLAKVKLNGLAG